MRARYGLSCRQSVEAGVFLPAIRHPDSGPDLARQGHLLLPHPPEMPRTGPPRFVTQSGEVPYGFLAIQGIAKRIGIGVVADVAVGPQRESSLRTIAGEERPVLAEGPDQGSHLLEEPNGMRRQRPGTLRRFVVADSRKRLVHTNGVGLQDLHDPASLLQQVFAPRG